MIISQFVYAIRWDIDIPVLNVSGSKSNVQVEI